MYFVLAIEYYNQRKMSKKEEFMKINLAERGADYYKLVGEKNAEGINSCLHPDVEFYSPLATLKGKEAIFKATCNFMKAFKTLTIRAKFGAEDQAVIIYDTDIPGIASDFPGASLLQFRDGLIIRIELFHDASHILKKKEEVFS